MKEELNDKMICSNGSMAMRDMEVKTSTDKAKVYYVYLLYDSQTKEIFYVGKGKGKRFLNHLAEAQKDNDTAVENKKIERIKQIGEKRFACAILRRNLTSKEALHVEAATIDLLRATTFKNISSEILNIQSGHGNSLNGIINDKKFVSMNSKYVNLLKSETLLCLNVGNDEVTRASSISQLVHKKKWKVNSEEASKASYVAIECDNIVIALYKSDCWKDNQDGKSCTFNGYQINAPEQLLERFISNKVPKRKRGTPQARYINHTDVAMAKK